MGRILEDGDYTGFCIKHNSEYVPLFFGDRIKVTYKESGSIMTLVIVDRAQGCKFIAYNEKETDHYRYLPSIMKDYIEEECSIEILSRKKS